ncbi:cysteine--tRNA ligase [Natroniella sulfidigena]|uniref:cysteine--tRNA ligase n=1 Tax=Natroniella sulfidigena TaxID=723921 RepID=UPI00200A2747|nr:cysteine--tRNA ligase [Natroniella sulfidigena]
MTLRVYNTLTGSKEEFETIEEGKVKIYSCGPTVYDYFHIGNARAFVVPDIIKRYLEYKGYQVTHVLNFTDVDDKMIKRADEEGINIQQLADRFITAFFEDAQALNLKKADFYPQATEHISEMIELIKDLLTKDYAYQSEGDVYFRIEKFDDYGKLSKQKVEDLEAGARVDVSNKKENPLDFTLWKRASEEPRWDSPWGAGRPGWHLECSVMSRKYLGDRFDIHTGGVDLVFPHHENEIAQSEACCGQQVVNYWLHNGYINIDGEKMSKSLGNFFTTREILSKYPAKVVRLFLIAKHYRSPINFSDQELENTATGLARLENAIEKINYLVEQEAVAGQLDGTELKELATEKKEKFMAAMDDDFNTALAIGALYELAKEVNRFVNSEDFELTQSVKEVLVEIEQLFKELGEDVLGIELTAEAGKDEQLVDSLVELLLDVREEAREKQEYQLADQIRDRLSELGVEVKDTPQGSQWKLS